MNFDLLYDIIIIAVKHCREKRVINCAKAQKGRKYMKNLKTKIAAGILAATTAFGSAAPALAADISSLYDKMFTDDTSIDIVYNGEILTYTDVEPQIINDRTMIPFRAVLETMGATVNYDDATRAVTATRGDTTINFSLDSNVIDIDENGTKSQIEMDVPMTVVNDRTLVPVRFISNSLGMNVGWDADLRTVVIVDTEKYVDEIMALPAMGKLMNVKNQIPAVQNGAFTIEIGFGMASENAGSASDLSVDVRMDTAYDLVYTNGVMGGKAAVNLDIDDLNKVVAALGSADVQIKNIENATIDVVADEGVLYFKTDLIEKIAAAYPEATQIASVAQFADKNTWFKWDIAASVNAMVQEDPAMKPLADLVNGGFSGLNEMTLEDAFEMIFASTGEASLASAEMMETMVSVYTMMDKYITVTVEENGDYTLSMNMTEDDFINMIAQTNAQMGYELDSEELKEMKDMFDLTVKADSAVKDGKTSSGMEYVIGFSYGDDTESVKFNIKMTATSTGDMNATPETPKVPSSALDVMDVINLLDE